MTQEAASAIARMDLDDLLDEATGRKKPDTEPEPAVQCYHCFAPLERRELTQEYDAMTIPMGGPPRPRIVLLKYWQCTDCGTLFGAVPKSHKSGPRRPITLVR